MPIRAGVLKGSGTAVVTVRGGDGRGDGRWDGLCGGGGGASPSTLDRDGGQPARSCRTAGDQDARRPRKREHTGASGVAYLSCGDDVPVYIDNENIGSSMETHLVDDGVTEYA